ncbi:MAG: hypothetical protein QG670_2107 [Thermoproteota archaeon]|nr:hypothetical protein [Thermoproteota archaeon]
MFLRLNSFINSEVIYVESGEVRKKVEPTIQDISGRLDRLEVQTRMGAEKVESYTRENPLLALGLAALGGLIIGMIVGSGSRNR